MRSREIDDVRKLSVHDLAVLLDKVGQAYVNDSQNCPLCIGCKKAREYDVDCIKAREMFLKKRKPDLENSLLNFY